MELRVLANTVLKPSTDQASTLPANVLVPVGKGQVLHVKSYLEEAGHLKIALDPEKIDYRQTGGRNTFWIYSGHVEDPAGFGSSNNPKDTPPETRQNSGMGHPFILPGNRVRTWSGQPVHDRKAKSFTWGELLHFGANGSYRPPENAAVVNNLIQIAIRAQEIRDKLGVPAIVRSGYRDKKTNARVGGASQSQHVLGNALDLAFPGHRPSDLYRRLSGSWQGGLAYSNSMDFLHIDRRPGGNARWVYPGG